jgi:hypothetical protein
MGERRERSRHDLHVATANLAVQSLRPSCNTLRTRHSGNCLGKPPRGESVRPVSKNRVYSPSSRNSCTAPIAGGWLPPPDQVMKRNRVTFCPVHI